MEKKTYSRQTLNQYGNAAGGQLLKDEPLTARVMVARSSLLPLSRPHLQGRGVCLGQHSSVETSLSLLI